MKVNEYFFNMTFSILNNNQNKLIYKLYIEYSFHILNSIYLLFELISQINYTQYSIIIVDAVTIITTFCFHDFLFGLIV